MYIWCFYSVAVTRLTSTLYTWPALCIWLITVVDNLKKKKNIFLQLLKLPWENSICIILASFGCAFPFPIRLFAHTLQQLHAEKGIKTWLGRQDFRSRLQLKTLKCQCNLNVNNKENSLTLNGFDLSTMICFADFSCFSILFRIEFSSTLIEWREFNETYAVFGWNVLRQ